MAGGDSSSGGAGVVTTVVLLLVSVVTMCGAAIYLYVHLAKRRRRVWAEARCVVVHCPPPGALTPSISPFVLKLLTFLRLAKIPYQLDHSEPLGASWLTPWVTMEDGEEVADSGIVIQELRRRLNLDLGSSLTAVEQAVARTFTVLVEEHLCWCLREWRIKIDGGRNLFEGASPPPWYMRAGLRVYAWMRTNTLWHQGIGRLPHLQVRKLTWRDLQALSDYLGEKSFLVGEEMTEVDCTVFAQMVNILCNYKRSPYHAMLTDEFPNLVCYVKRIKERLWPDWDACLASS
ncbi:failed axon connections homolog isoform X2 [Portunus trituberculatus]|uniref:failed axon connections homolog isoform X2 n=1 Tax=Portunus trituberculatus TaxID=210409 RepID=UPI001E1D1F92|nr:failed axon connections homolog isoform X2 [Portunus trituberculatus]